MKLMFIGDIHIRGNNPRNRKDNYFETLKAKLRECWKIAEERKVKAILQPGDIFHTPEVSIKTLLEAVEVFKECPVPFYCTPGNHDLHGYNIESYNRTSLNLLCLLTAFGVEVGGTGGKIASDTLINDYDSKSRVWVSLQPYTSDVDINGAGYWYDYKWCKHTEEPRVKIHVVHGMLLDHNLPYEARYTNIYNVETNADIILSGHDHVGYGVIKRSDGKVFCNPGALMRLSASHAEMERTVQVAIIDTETREIELVPLQTAKPAEEVLDRSGIEANQERQYAMEEFAAVIQSKTGERITLNVPEIIERIAKEEGVAADVAKKALELVLDTQR